MFAVSIAEPQGKFSGQHDFIVDAPEFLLIGYALQTLDEKRKRGLPVLVPEECSILKTGTQNTFIPLTDNVHVRY